MKSKKAMSEIVTTIIMIVLALVAVGVIWSIVTGLIGSKTGQITDVQKCLDVKLSFQGITCSAANSCTAMIKREAGGTTFTGIKFSMRSPTSSSRIVSYVGNIDPLATVNVPITRLATDTFDFTTTSLIEATAYFTDSSGKESLCSQQFTYNRVP